MLGARLPPSSSAATASITEGPLLDLALDYRDGRPHHPRHPGREIPTPPATRRREHNAFELAEVLPDEAEALDEEG